METINEKTERIRKIIDQSYIDKGINYATYRKLIDDLLKEDKSTGPNQSASLTAYSKLNVVRMNRLDKTTELLPALKDALLNLAAKQTWLVLTEGWCGDAAQIVPVFAKIASFSDKIDLRFLLRDENPELMDQYLYKGRSKSIPKLIALDENNHELFNWGPRPGEAQALFESLKDQQESYDVIKEKIHGWYAKDKTISTQKELTELLINLQEG